MKEIKVNEYYSKLDGNGQCKCYFCNASVWTSLCLKITDDNSSYKGVIICSTCLRKEFPQYCK